METERVKRSAYAEFSSEDFNVKLFIPSLLAKFFLNKKKLYFFPDCLTFQCCGRGSEFEN